MSVCVELSAFLYMPPVFLEGDGLTDAWVGGWFPQMHRSLQSNFPLMLSALLDISLVTFSLSLSFTQAD